MTSVRATTNNLISNFFVFSSKLHLFHSEGRHCLVKIYIEQVKFQIPTPMQAADSGKDPEIYIALALVIKFQRVSFLSRKRFSRAFDPRSIQTRIESTVDS